MNAIPLSPLNAIPLSATLLKKLIIKKTKK